MHRSAPVEEESDHIRIAVMPRRVVEGSSRAVVPGADIRSPREEESRYLRIRVVSRRVVKGSLPAVVPDGDAPAPLQSRNDLIRSGPRHPEFVQ